jgi:hypothetical protein
VIAAKAAEQSAGKPAGNPEGARAFQLNPFKKDGGRPPFGNAPKPKAGPREGASGARKGEE